MYLHLCSMLNVLLFTLKNQYSGQVRKRTTRSQCFCVDGFRQLTKILQNMWNDHSQHVLEPVECQVYITVQHLNMIKDKFLLVSGEVAKNIFLYFEKIKNKQLQEQQKLTRVARPVSANVGYTLRSTEED